MAKESKADARDSKNPVPNKQHGKKPPGVKSGGFFKSLITRIFGRSDKPTTAQQSIPYREMYRDGMCRVNDRLFTKTITFGDINYHLAQNEDKAQIFENYCDFLNYFDSSIGVQISAVNNYGNIDELMKSIDITMRDDANDPLRDEYSGILKGQQAKGNNGLVKSKYITFGIEADNLKAAKLRTERVEADILNNCKTLGVTAKPLNGTERLEVLHGLFHPGYPNEQSKNTSNPVHTAGKSRKKRITAASKVINAGGNEQFRFNWKDIPNTGLSTKDFIAPTSFDFRDGRVFRMGEYYGAVSYLQILAPELTDRMLADFLDLDSAVTVTLHIKSIDQSEAIKTIKRKLSDLDKMKIEEQKKAVRSGYDMDIIPTDLATYGSEAKTLLEDLQSRNERMFLVTILILNSAKTRQKLENNIFAAAGVAQKYNCALKRLDYQQEHYPSV
jgi:hypothetical protein